MIRFAQLTSPFVLIAVGAAVFYLSPWPVIVHLMMSGAHVRVAPTWRTYGVLAAAVACWGVAIWLSLRIAPSGRG